MLKYLKMVFSFNNELIEKHSGFPTCLHNNKLIHSDSQDRYDKYECIICGKKFIEDWEEIKIQEGGD